MHNTSKDECICKKSFFIKDDELLQKYNEIWDKFSNVIKKRFDNEYVCDQKYLKTKIKSYEVKIITVFHNDEIPKQSSLCIHLSVMLIDSVFRIN